MKKTIISTLFIALAVCFIALSCDKKNNDSALTPTYKDQSTTTGANPQTTNVTTTGASGTTGTATQNSSIAIGGAGWLFQTCSGNTIVAQNSSGTIVTIYFSAPPTNGPYTLISSTSGLTSTTACMLIENPPSQPSGSDWYSANGTITVSSSGGGKAVTFSNIACKQTGTQFPIVTAGGSSGCQ